MTLNSDNEKLIRLSAYVDGQLNADESSRFELELENDSELRDLMEQYLANGEAIRQLPRFQLPSDFADRVLAKIDDEVPSAPSPRIGELSSPQDQRATRTALGLIVSLAAMLLVSLLISPWMVSPKSDNVAHLKSTEPESQNPPKVATANEPATAPGALASEPKQEPNPGATMLADNEPTNRRSPRMLGHRPKAMSSGRGTQRSGIVAAMPPVQEVLLVKFSGAEKPSREDRLQVIQKVFSETPSGAIRIKPAAGDLNLERDFAVGKETQAIVVIASNAEMKQVVTRLKKQPSVSVRAIPLGGQGEANGTTAQWLKTYELNRPKTNQNESADIDPKELELLDRWFGLANEPQSKSLSRFLILID